MKCIYHTGKLNVDISSIMDYNPGNLIEKVASVYTTLSLDVMNRPTIGVAFFFMENNKINIITNYILIGYLNMDIQPSKLLWAQLDKVENAYMARFLTPESVDSIYQSDILSNDINIKPSSKILEWAKSWLYAIHLLMKEWKWYWLSLAIVVVYMITIYA